MAQVSKASRDCCHSGLSLRGFILFGLVGTSWTDQSLVAVLVGTE